MAKWATSIGKVSGTSAFASHFLFYRYDKRYGLQQDVSETWLMQVEGLNLHPLLTTGGTFDDIWRSPTGSVYVVALNALSFNKDPRPRATPFQERGFPCTLRGVWGLDDDFIFVWGQGSEGEMMFLWNGKTWAPIKSPGYVQAMHGIQTDLVYAVGEEGMIARWDGSGWTRLTAPVPGVVSDVFVVSRDEIYATGQGNYLFEGSVYGWSTLLQHKEPITRVARHGDTLYVGCPREGLLKREGQQLVVSSADYKPLCFDVRGKLLMSTTDKVAESDDGQKFSGVPISAPEQIAKGSKPRWL